MLIDSHCHLPNNESEIKEWLNNAAQEGVKKTINIGTSLKDNERCIEIAEKYENVYATVGIYPHENLDTGIEELKQKLQQQIGSSKKIVGVGECGIDITKRQEETKNNNKTKERSLEDQIKLFEMHIELAMQNNLPLVIHNRNGDEQVINSLSKYTLSVTSAQDVKKTAPANKNQLKGVAHCFASSWETAQKLLELNFYISFSGLITYPSGKDLLETVQKVPLNKFLIETDAPFLLPQDIRSSNPHQKNQPKYVRMIAQKVAETKGLPFELICSSSYQNTRKIFNLI
ncbi:hypothetical protein A3F07_00055 [candidate division WWE3 bacterium RIFCSPHIGHO2_12_FULL_38_15]|uniref:Hydrolase TatD n=1 Tax=candidate division WWE3 bacterium RIFCSPHIGHO2_02_FULL_38_14 TaxID=1802620 RepID=A0A1F4V771_UNCKA|nr:MAG: hypothetical protein A2793_01145 [candidate division WWE3 bacterium RIFCSPHIGHO2_01_FULL_38_45]OGC49231.1 MAG: hypothetical protein A3F07_00055 [candidate division WWE3 bacterium RIFCSPHIGHO2_12_FULL_38_15]OGC52850.1 MAG: hypothetical protein A3D91_00500 [candidate division WWE3 bacterium RIFCSPHIGHO2_02_FULL_38_14]OGC54126.1 MAG: hypothetical protein A3B64_00320 [candidate division WWE3 bacterium RIFCSPLOWO2_01_FULL_37_24]HLB51321.1 TatD family hydrolase [Patescibacteria group bacteriu